MKKAVFVIYIILVFGVFDKRKENSIFLTGLTMLTRVNRVGSDPNQLGPFYKRCPRRFTAVNDLVRSGRIVSEFA